MGARGRREAGQTSDPSREQVICQQTRHLAGPPKSQTLRGVCCALPSICRLPQWAAEMGILGHGGGSCAMNQWSSWVWGDRCLLFLYVSSCAETVPGRTNRTAQGERHLSATQGLCAGHSPPQCATPSHLFCCCDTSKSRLYHEGAPPPRFLFVGPTTWFTAGCDPVLMDGDPAPSLPGSVFCLSDRQMQVGPSCLLRIPCVVGPLLQRQGQAPGGTPKGMTGTCFNVCCTQR